MKRFLLKAAIASAGFIAASAYADVVPPSSGNGELTLFARDEVTQVVYARGLGYTLNDLLPESVTGGAYSGPTTGNALPFSTITADDNMHAFLTGAAGHTVTWGIQSADQVGSNIASDPRRLAVTTPADLVANFGVPSNSTLTPTVGVVNSLLTTVNNNLPDPTGSSVFGGTDTGGLWGNAGTSGEDARTLGGVDNVSFLGDAARFYLITSSGTSAAGQNGTPGRTFQFADLTLNNNGDLVSAGAPVPLPAAVWLLGSGLLGLVGVGRRRRNV